VIETGDGGVGLVAVPGGEGYHNDEAASAKTFRRIGDQLYTIPGDVATVAEDGNLVLLGRGSMVINTAGEKVYPGEVEDVLRAHPEVEDVLVFGVDHERFGQQVAAVLSFVDGAMPSVDEVLATAGQRLASYKLPTTVAIVEEVPRTPVGKADYSAARTRLVAADGPA
jgi:3-oxocholest-4-en-26-oate---CoA ligase